MSDVNIFEQASKQGMRFFTEMGTLMVDDLWNYNLQNLDKLAISYQKEISDSGDSESFITKKSTVDKRTVLGLEICKRIIEVRVADLEKVEKSIAKKQRNARIMEIMADKQDGALQEKSLEELQEMLESD